MPKLREKYDQMRLQADRPAHERPRDRQTDILRSEYDRLLAEEQAAAATHPQIGA